MPESRVTPVREDEVRSSERSAYDAVRSMLDQPFFTEKSKYDPSDLFDALLHAPQLTQKLIELGGSLRSLGAVGEDGDLLPTDFVEFITFVVFTDLHSEALRRGSAFTYTRPMYNHVSRAVEAGMRPEAIDALRSGDTTALLPEETELVRFVRAVLAGEVTDEIWRSMVDRVGQRRAIESTAFVLLDFFMCRLESALGLSNAPESEVDQVLGEYMDQYRGKNRLSL